jgi:hypothetical protein
MSLIGNGGIATCVSHIYMKVLLSPLIAICNCLFCVKPNGVKSLALFWVSSQKLALKGKIKKKIDIEMIIKRSCLNAFDCSLMGRCAASPR